MRGHAVPHLVIAAQAGGGAAGQGTAIGIGCNLYYICRAMDDLVSAKTRRQLTDAELAEIRRRRPGVRASLACEGMYLTAEEEALFEQMDRERLSPDARAARLTEFYRAKRKQKAPISG